MNFLDLIPILSYIFIGGKCRYCKEKIRPRYIIIELTSGLVFLIFSMLLSINILNIEIIKISTLIFGMLFFSAVFIQCGIVKEYKKINKSVFNFGIIVELIYMIYLYILNTSIYRYIIYMVLIVAMAFVNNNKKMPEIAKKSSFMLFCIIGITEIMLILI